MRPCSLIIVCWSSSLRRINLWSEEENQPFPPHNQDTEKGPLLEFVYLTSNSFAYRKPLATSKVVAVPLSGMVAGTNDGIPRASHLLPEPTAKEESHLVWLV